MQLRSTTAKFKARRPENAMKYTAKLTNGKGLSKDAKAAFETTFRTLTEKAIREKRIPDELLFVVQTNAPELDEELTAAGLQEYAFTDAKGVRVYRHKVDKEALKEALGWNRN